MNVGALRRMLAFALVAWAAPLPMAELPPAHAYPALQVQFEGHGWGHGRGMGQWGALGYALERGWSYEQILDHFYGGTRAGTVEDLMMSVRLTRLDGWETVVRQQGGHLVSGADAARESPALRAVLVGQNLFQLYEADDVTCAGPWTPLGDPVTGPVTFSSTGAGDDLAGMLQVCEPEGIRWLRGEISAVDDAGVARTVNHLPMEQYLRGVLPAEMPPSWGSLGDGAGAQALAAQAVAARSYAAAEQRHPYAKTCDSTACQVYLGRAYEGSAGFRDMEDPSTDAAVASTAGQVRRLGEEVARTEFSASTGGWSAGGAFAAVRDEGDKISTNPHHVWRASVPVEAVEAAFPEVGKLLALTTVERNGLGEWGGRVTEVRVEGAASASTITGKDLRSKLKLKSDWFRVLAPGGYWLVSADGKVSPFGNADLLGSMDGVSLDRPVVAAEATPSRKGYWLAASDGGVFAFGDAGFFGSAASKPLDKPVVAMASTPTGKGYWLAASDGEVHHYGDAAFFGSADTIQLARPVTGMRVTPSGAGYYLVASDGGVFAFGDAGFFGSSAVTVERSVAPFVGIALTHLR